MKKFLSVAIISALVLVGHTAMADTNQKKDGQTEARILADLKKKYPSTTFTTVTKAPLGNLFEVVMRQNIAYVDPDTNYLMFGHIFDMKTQHDMTQDRLEELNKLDFSSLPLDKAIKIVKGDGSRAFAVFTDPECPYCYQLEQNLLDVNNYTMYVFLFPIAELHPTAHTKAEAIWCSKDPVKAWAEAMLEHKEIVSTKCATPIAQVAALGQSLGVRGTPTLISSDGRRAPGAMPAQALETWLDAKIEQAVPNIKQPK